MLFVSFEETFFETPVLALHCRLAYLVKPMNGWPKEAIDNFRLQLTTSSLYVEFVSYNALCNISAVTIRDKSGNNQVHLEFSNELNFSLNINPRLIVFGLSSLSR